MRQFEEILRVSGLFGCARKDDRPFQVLPDPYYGPRYGELMAILPEHEVALIARMDKTVSLVGVGDRLPEFGWWRAGIQLGCWVKKSRELLIIDAPVTTKSMKGLLGR